MLWVALLQPTSVATLLPPNNPVSLRQSLRDATTSASARPQTRRTRSTSSCLCRSPGSAARKRPGCHPPAGSAPVAPAAYEPQD
eukprot:5606999-Prymnesium_polylepis.1